MLCARYEAPPTVPHLGLGTWEPAHCVQEEPREWEPAHPRVAMVRENTSNAATPRSQPEAPER